MLLKFRLQVGSFVFVDDVALGKLHNRYYHKTARNAVRNLRKTTDKKEAAEMYPKVVSMLDKLTKRNIIHKNKAANLKSKLQKHISGLG